MLISEDMAIIVAIGVKFCMTSSFRIRSFGVKPVRGGSPLMDSNINVSVMLAVVDEVHMVVES